jgi:transcriptional regulator with XRE-family HTH domain
MKNLNKKQKAIALRKKGKSLNEIAAALKIPKSTLSGWLKNIKMSLKFKKALFKKRLDGLAVARIKAATSHKQERLKRMAVIEKDASLLLKGVKIDRTAAELIFSSFYLAEGAKRRGSFEIANSNPEILVGFWNLMRNLYPLDLKRVRCHLYLRLDQSEKKLKNFWSHTLNIPEKQFIKSQFDKRAVSATRDNYNGVCCVYYNDVNLQKRAIAIGEELLKKLKNINNLGN